MGAASSLRPNISQWQRFVVRLVRLVRPAKGPACCGIRRDKLPAHTPGCISACPSHLSVFAAPSCIFITLPAHSPAFGGTSVRPLPPPLAGSRLLKGRENPAAAGWGGFVPKPPAEPRSRRGSPAVGKVQSAALPTRKRKRRKRNRDKTPK